MTILENTDQIFFEKTEIDRARLEGIVDDVLGDADDGELFLEYRQSEGLSYDDGRLRSASYDTTQGFGLRAISGEAVGYSHASELSESSIKRAANTVSAV